MILNAFQLQCNGSDNARPFVRLGLGERLHSLRHAKAVAHRGVPGNAFNNKGQTLCIHTRDKRFNAAVLVA